MKRSIVTKSRKRQRYRSSFFVLACSPDSFRLQDHDGYRFNQGPPVAFEGSMEGFTLARSLRQKALGIAYFSPVFSVLYLTEDVPIANEAAAIDLARMRGSPVDTCQSEVGKLALPVVEQVKPEVVLVSVRASDELVNALQEICSLARVSSNSVRRLIQ